MAKQKSEEQFLEDIKNKYGEGYCLVDGYKGSSNNVKIKHDCGHAWEMLASTIHNSKKKILCPICNKRYKDKKSYYKSFYNKYSKDEFEIMDETFIDNKSLVSVLHKKCGRVITRKALYNTHPDRSTHNMCEECKEEGLEKSRLGKLKEKLSVYKNIDEFEVVSGSLEKFKLRHLKCGEEFYKYGNMFKSSRDELVCRNPECVDIYWENTRIKRELEDSERKSVHKLALRLKEYYNQVVRDYNSFIKEQYKDDVENMPDLKEQMRGTSYLRDITGMRFGMLTAMSYIGKYKNSGKAAWRCICDCGEIFEIDIGSLSSGHTSTCGCQGRKILTFKRNGVTYRRTDLTGLKVGSLTVKEVIGHDISNAKQTRWLAVCDCGNLHNVAQQNLMSKTTTSCGCVGSSRGEFLIKGVLDKYGILYSKEYTFSDLKHKGLLRFDFALKDKKGNVISLIEFDGVQHFKDVGFSGSFEETQYRDELKNTYCRNNKIPLTRIPYTDIDFTEEIIEDLLEKHALI